MNLVVLTSCTQEKTMQSEDIRSELVKKLATLLERSGAIHEHLRDTPPSDWEELATFREDDEVAEALDDITRAEIEDIKYALRRMDAGEWEYCESCGNEIRPERLKALPTTSFCIKCASEKERT
ncbi:MAG: TraR/DksA family transcriptional regulator [Proteobacteria bacterium]|nr:MAG: TraR/DksA family transcriptional regulator [Pseudomonadota bacterium]